MHVQNKNKKLFSTTILFLFHNLQQIEGCSSFYCINNCGGRERGYKLILANNRDENIYRLTIPANVWQPKLVADSKNFQNFFKQNSQTIYCNQHDSPKPYNLCVYGALDLARGTPPKIYSTWLAINERGNMGNILFYMVSNNTNKKPLPVGGIIGSYLQDSSWPSAETFLANLTAKKNAHRPFNYIHLEMSKKTGSYSLYYLNNSDTQSAFQKMNANDLEPFYFALSNSNPNQQFNKAVKGEGILKSAIKGFEQTGEKDKLVNSLIYDLLQNTEENYPDPNLSASMNIREGGEALVRNVSKINADYGGFWRNAHTRTSTVILVDYENNVEYYELNLTSWKNETDFNVAEKDWKLNSFKFKLKPVHKGDENSAPSCLLNELNALFATIFATFSLYITNNWVLY